MRFAAHTITLVGLAILVLDLAVFGGPGPGSKVKSADFLSPSVIVGSGLSYPAPPVSSCPPFTSLKPEGSNKAARQCILANASEQKKHSGTWVASTSKQVGERCDVIKFGSSEFDVVYSGFARLASLYNVPALCGQQETDAWLAGGKERQKQLDAIKAKYVVPPCGPEGGKKTFSENLKYTWDENLFPLGRDFDAAKFMDAMAGKHVIFFGDSLMRQWAQALGCFLSEAGFHAEGVRFSMKGEMELRFPNGLKLSRWNLLLLNEDYLAMLPDMLTHADVAIVNIGHHYPYGNWSDYRRDLRQLLEVTTTTSTPVVFVESNQPHFPTPTGDVLDPRRILPRWIQSRKDRGAYPCDSLRDKTGQNTTFRNSILHEEAKKFGMPVLNLWDIYRDRFDVHQGYKGFGKTTRKLPDCLHFCYQSNTFAPIVIKLADYIEVAMHCGTRAKIV